MPHPNQNEYAPYYNQYIQKVPEGNIIEFLTRQMGEAVKFFSGIPEDKSSFRYAEGKWSIKEVLQHIADAERIFAYRALCISRNNKNNLPGFDENDFARNTNCAELKLADILEEFIALRQSNLKMFNNLSDKMWMRKGMANNNHVTVRAIAYIIAGHALHHMDVLRERYLRV